MKGSPDAIKALQAGLPLEGHLNMQCRQDQRVVKFKGVKKVAKHIKKMGDNAHDFQKYLTKRILFLEGDVGFTLPAVEDGDRSLTQILQNLLGLNMDIIKPYEQAIQTAAKVLDDTTRNLFEHLLKWHEQDVYWLEQQLDLIKSLGETEYIAEKLG